MSKAEAARLGGLARVRMHGNPGTEESRRKGGLRSIQTHKAQNTGFKIEKKFRKPKNCADLAEFIGIFAGDGHLAEYQALVSTNAETDIDHARYVKYLASKLFKLEASLNYKRPSKAIEVAISSIGLVKWLHKKGMPLGNKLNELCIPAWVQTNPMYLKKYIRGLFDTDGCVFIDTHVIRGKTYMSRGWTITSYSAKLRNEIKVALESMGFKPSLRDSQKSVYMRRKADIERYFREIGSSNSKHLKRYARSLTK